MACDVREGRTPHGEEYRPGCIIDGCDPMRARATIRARLGNQRKFVVGFLPIRQRYAISCARKKATTMPHTGSACASRWRLPADPNPMAHVYANRNHVEVNACRSAIFSLPQRLTAGAFNFRTLT